MKKRLKAFSRTTIALLTAALVCSPFTKAYADDTVDSLEKQTNGLQNQLDSLNQDLTSLSAEITDLASKIEDTDASVQKAELDLAAAKLDEQLQYDAMKKRIKYMYETGNTSLLQIIFSSESMGDFLNKAEFVKNITEYDRNMLDELQKVHELVAKKDSDLKAEQASLAEMKTNLDQQEQELNDKISSTSGELQASSEALAKAKEAQAAAAAALKKKQEEEDLKNAELAAFQRFIPFEKTNYRDYLVARTHGAYFELTQDKKSLNLRVKNQDILLRICAAAAQILEEEAAKESTQK